MNEEEGRVFGGGADWPVLVVGEDEVVSVMGLIVGMAVVWAERVRDDVGDTIVVVDVWTVVKLGDVSVDCEGSVRKDDMTGVEIDDTVTVGEEICSLVVWDCTVSD